MSAVGTSPLPGSRRSAVGALSALSVVLIWASWLVSTRHSVGAGLGPLDLSLLRYGIPALVLAPVWWRTGLFPKGAMAPLTLMILGSGAHSSRSWPLACATTPASAAGVLLSGLMPLAVAVIGMAFLGERPTNGASSGWSRSLPAAPCSCWAISVKRI